MYIKKVRKSNRNSKKVYEYLHLVENVRTEKGPRQKLILNLGALDLPAEQYKEPPCVRIDVTYDDPSWELVRARRRPCAPGGAWPPPGAALGSYLAVSNPYRRQWRFYALF